MGSSIKAYSSHDSPMMFVTKIALQYRITKNSTKIHVSTLMASMKPLMSK